MKGFYERTFNSKHCCKTYSDSPNRTSGSVCSGPGSSDSKLSRTSLWSGFFLSAFSTFETHGEPKGCGKKGFGTRSNGWTAAMKRVMNGGSMRRIQERVLGLYKTGIFSSTSDIWHLAFVEDFSSRILLTYCKGFAAIGDSKYTSDALIVHQLGRSWRKTSHKNTFEILHLFGDSEASTLSIHNLLQAGNGYDLAAGSWVGPYAMCHTWESLVRFKREESELEDQSFPMAIYVVSSDEDGERGGAPVGNWTPILLLVPLVLGLDKINPRYLVFIYFNIFCEVSFSLFYGYYLPCIENWYIPLLSATFTFPQSLGILGSRPVITRPSHMISGQVWGVTRPGASTYIVSVQDEEAFYLDPHEIQSVVDIRRDNLEANTSSYHCNVVRHVPLDSIDSSLAIGFYCRDKDDFCYRASKLADESKGAPLFTVTHTRNPPRTAEHYDMLSDTGQNQLDKSFDIVHDNNAGGGTQEDDCDWQLL
ncbi:Cysteine protease ATG4 [Camellia lanceoleosa]|uniref:Cysteine protease ATG4 n=1 Tax=Camellia lanceoleosa TaxID=1840588 RepID=A0ACC0GRM7_9ERIC|nr:Cysteine protease ATG4 [Camellia lanceoleosa]